jgi:hypothetical protein
MERFQVSNLSGKTVMFLDFTNLQKIEQIEELVKKVKDFVQRQPLLSLYSLTNIEGMHFNSQIKDLFTDLAKSNKPYVRAGAIVGVTGLKQILFNGVMKLSGRDLKSFSDLENAKKWLLSIN